MINKKIAPYHFPIIGFWFLTLFFSCDNQELITFEKEEITSEILTSCVDQECASITINLLKCAENSEIAERINAEIERVACKILTNDDKNSNHNITAAVAQFNDSYLEMKAALPDETFPYEVAINYKKSFQNKTLISIMVDLYMFTGGAHGYSSVSFLNLNPKTGKSFSQTSLLRDQKKFTSFVETEFRKANSIPKDQSINSTGFFFENEVFALPEAIGFSETEVLLLFNTYEIGAYTDGTIELKLDKSKVVSYFEIDIL